MWVRGGCPIQCISLLGIPIGKSRANRCGAPFAIAGFHTYLLENQNDI
jgi:hypothetical protein